MEDFISDLQQRAASKQKRIVLPESTDERIMRAAEIISKKKIAKVTMVGEQVTLQQQAKKINVSLANIDIISQQDAVLTRPFAITLNNQRQHKGMTLNMAEQIMLTDPLFFGAMYVAAGKADGMVAGAINPTKNTIKAALHCIGMKKNASIISSFFIMLLPTTEYGQNGVLFYADCGVNPNPDAEQLADIAIATVDSNKMLMQRKDQKVALLSFSTKGSAEDDSVLKVREALKIIKQKEPDIVADGELQFDAALVPDVAKKKAPGSPVAGQANIFIFPDLNAGNIGYKITERLGGAEALGPILQGTLKPVNDLSRGCSVEDIVNVAAITVLQCE
ncbi:MAG: phosphate acetyltransferase [Candidatus Margulisiibacteriota bacterium]|jgi:phosphate acetyltransferase